VSLPDYHDVTEVSEHLAGKHPDTLASRRVTAADPQLAPDEVPYTGADLRELRDLP
jgi:hypothetical protein